MRVVLTDPQLLIFSGEKGSTNGTWEVYTGNCDTKSICDKLRKERCGGDRWVSIFKETGRVDNNGNWLYQEYDHITGQGGKLIAIPPEVLK